VQDVISSESWLALASHAMSPRAGHAVKVLSAAVDPDLAGDEITGLRERLGEQVFC
jgi:hypothetical protein